MSDPSKTHKASPRRVKEFRKRGEIALSRDLLSAATLSGGVIALVATAGAAATALIDFTRNAVASTDGRDTASLPSAAIHAFSAAAGPVLVGAAIAALIAMALQLGWPPAFKGIGIDFSRLNPAKNLPNVFGFSSMARRTGGAVAKLVAVGSIAVLALGHSLINHAVDIRDLGGLAWHVIMRALGFVLCALVAIGAVDYVLSRRKITEQMKMSTEELKREHKESDGDPMMKGKRKARMREMARRRVAQAVAKADVVIVNPTHYSVALRYDEKQDRAPIVVAKGMDEAAAKIREIARENGVPILERPPLARALHKHVKEGKQVPSNLYKAVAEVLAYVYRLRSAR